MARVIDENSTPGIYMGAGMREGKWWPIMTIVHPPHLRAKMGKTIEHGECGGTNGFDTEFEVEAYIRCEMMPQVIRKMGPFYDRTEELRPGGERVMEKRLLEDVEKVVLAARMREDGTWAAVMAIIYQDKARTTYVGEHPQSFATCEEATAWSKQNVEPLLAMADLLAPGGDRPEGLRCTSYDFVDGKRVYCGQPATWHLTFPHGNFPIEYCCDAHHLQLMKESQSDLLKNSLRRIN